MRASSVRYGRFNGCCSLPPQRLLGPFAPIAAGPRDEGGLYGCRQRWVFTFTPSLSLLGDDLIEQLNRELFGTEGGSMAAAGRIMFFEFPECD